MGWESDPVFLIVLWDIDINIEMVIKSAKSLIETVT